MPGRNGKSDPSCSADQGSGRTCRSSWVLAITLTPAELRVRRSPRAIGVDLAHENGHRTCSTKGACGATRTDLGLLVSVRGSGRARVVPVRHELEHLAAAAHTALIEAAVADPRADATRLFPGDDAASRLFGQLTWPPAVARPNRHRLRATWSALTFASGCGLPAYLRAAHITSLDSWMAPAALLPELPLDVYCARARGATDDQTSSPARAGNSRDRSVG